MKWLVVVLTAEHGWASVMYGYCVDEPVALAMCAMFRASYPARVFAVAAPPPR